MIYWVIIYFIVGIVTLFFIMGICSAAVRTGRLVEHDVRGIHYPAIQLIVVLIWPVGLFFFLSGVVRGKWNRGGK